MKKVLITGGAGYIGLCYHYIRSPRDLLVHPRILGHTEETLVDQCKMIKKYFQTVSPFEASHFFPAQGQYDGRYGVLVSFDDGLRDHYRAAEILADHGIQAFFFIPTCIIKEKLPANPNIIHYALALYGVEKFLKFFDLAMDQLSIDPVQFRISYVKGKDKVWDTIGKIKQRFKYDFDMPTARKMLIFIFEEFMLKDHPQMLSEIHLTDGQIKDMLAMGHAIGPHSHSHISVGSSSLSERDFHLEMVEPKTILEERFKTNVEAMSYPFGEQKDCLSSNELLKKTGQYKLAYTIKPLMNISSTDPLELGRYMLESGDDAQKLHDRLNSIISQQETKHALGSIHQ